MKRTYLAFLLLIALTPAFAQVTWVNKKNHTGSARFIATGFSVDGKGYLVGGRVTSSPITYVNEVKEYDPVNDTWVNKATLPVALASAHGFAINGKGYIAGGQNNTYAPVNTLYEYDPSSNTWTSKANVPVAMNGGFSFVVNNIAYIGTGARTGANNSTTFYAYDPSNNTWSSKANFIGTPIVGGIGFAIGNYGYAGCGTNGSNTLNNNFYKYDPSNNTWTQIAPLPGKERLNPIAFTLNGIGYVGGGGRQINGEYFCLSDFYAYDPSTDSWSPAPGLPGFPIQGGTTFVINNVGYEVGGYEYDGDIYYNMVSALGECGVISGLEFPGGTNEHRDIHIFPNPTSNDLNVKIAGEVLSELEYNITSMTGQLVKTGYVNSNTFSFSTNTFSEGIYLLSVKDNAGNYSVQRFEVVR